MKKTTVPLTHRTAAKATAFVLAISTALTALLSFIIIVAMLKGGVYFASKQNILEDVYLNKMQEDSGRLLDYVINENFTQAERYFNDNNFAHVKITKINTEESSSVVIYEFTNTFRPETGFTATSKYYDDSTAAAYTEVSLSLTESFELNDFYSRSETMLSLVYALRFWIIVILAASIIIFVLCFIFLICAAGHRADCVDVQQGWGTKIPLDFLTAVTIAIITFSVLFFCSNTSEPAFAVGFLVAYTISVIVLLGYSMSLALRIKLGAWWKNTLCYGAVCLLKKVFCALPLFWKTLLIITVITLTEFLVILFCQYEIDNLLILWSLEKIILIPCVLFCVYLLKRLKIGAKNLADGNLNFVTEDKWMFSDFKEHAENLNSISRGMNIAVEERLKSEKMKTELITNVSHDLKTPLTSIINYADLISKEECSNEKITEYSSVLLRQSERLKKLIDDLVEASKASTGNLDILLTPFDLTVLISQALGEYEQKFSDRSLQIIYRQPETPIKIMADGRRLWRVFDNLMNNICKYAQSNTRVYVSLEEKEGYANVSLKNISADPLNLSPDELTERFSRGDTSRNTEGNGLGLAIAKSLTQLQNGSMIITVDGDLFKVVLKFPCIREN